MPIDFLTDDTGRRVVFSGSFDPTDVTDAMRKRSGGDDDASSSTHTILDMSAVTGMDAAVEEIHHMLVAMRSAYPRGAEYRYALVRPAHGASDQMEFMITVRDLLLGRDASSLPQVQIFDDLAEARRWARPTDG